MANDQKPSSTICTLKMNINCCEKCPIKLQRKLLKSNGVESVTIEPDKGLVSVSGGIDPVVLIQKIKTMGKEAKLLFFQRKPDCDDEEKDEECSKVASKTECGGTESDSNNEDDNQFDWHSQRKCKTETMGMKEHDWGLQSSLAMSSNFHACSYSQSSPAMSSNFHASSYSPSLPAMFSNVYANSYHRSLPRLRHQPTWPYQQSVPGHRLTPRVRYLQAHPPPASRYFRPQSPPRANPVVHYTDYADNYSF